MKTQIIAIVLSLLWASFCATAQAQGLIGMAPEGTDPDMYFESQRNLVEELESKRTQMLRLGVIGLGSRKEYGAIVWKLAQTYESLCCWQQALDAYNTLHDLKLPGDALESCPGCAIEAKDDVLAIDIERLGYKVRAVEEVDHVTFTRNTRLPTLNAITIKFWSDCCDQGVAIATALSLVALSFKYYFCSGRSIRVLGCGNHTSKRNEWLGVANSKET